MSTDLNLVRLGRMLRSAILPLLTSPMVYSSLASYIWKRHASIVL